MSDQKFAPSEKNNGKVTVVVSVLNGVSTIQSCLTSIINLDYPLLEIIVIDGGSTDGTQSILNKYIEYIDYFISEPDDGIYDAWNKAIKVATGDWIAFIGSDDRWAGFDSLNNMMSLAYYPSVNFVSGKALLEDCKNTHLKSIGKMFDFKKLNRGIQFIHVGSIHHVSLFKTFGLFDTSYKIAGDYDFFVRNGRYIKPKFFEGNVVVMGVGGLSNTEPLLVFKEGYLILKKSPYFGFFLGLLFFAESYLKFYLRFLYNFKK